MNQTEKSITPMPVQYYVSDSEQNDEIDLFELVLSIFAQWKLILLIITVGTLLTIAYTTTIPKQYENYTQLRKPLISDIQIIKLNGYGVDLESLFLIFYNNLKSPEVFKNYLISTDIISKLYPKLKSTVDLNQAAIGMTSTLMVNYIDSENKTTKSGVKSDVFKVTLKFNNEDIAVNILNQYVKDIEQYTLKDIKEHGKYSISLRKQEIEEKISGLRNLAKQNRLNAIADLKETLNVASIMGVKKPLISIPTNANGSKSNGLTLFLSDSKQQQKYMVGSDYLNAEIKRLESRGFKLTSDDAFIGEIPKLVSELSILNKKSFNFDGAKLYTLEKLAAIDDAPVKPNKKLIVIIGMLLSGFLALFVALIISAVKKRNLLAEKNNEV